MFSPMQIEWKQKWLSFLYKGVLVTLHGIVKTPCSIPEITVNQLMAMEKEEAIWGIVQLYNIDSSVTTSVAPLPKGFQQLVD